MFIVLLKFADNKSKAPQFMSQHNEWIKNGLGKGIFLLTGSIRPGLGGVVLAHGVSKQTLIEIINEDPFVSEGVVSVEIIEISPGQATEPLKFLLEEKQS